MIGHTLSHYRVVEQIGSGGMGVVYRAHDDRLEREVALKVLPTGTLADEAARKRFRKEALALAKLSHPNIGVIHDFDTQDGVDFLVMEYIAGATLAERIAAGALPEKEVLALGAQIAAALEEAHEHGVVHRDLKPGNILVTPKGHAKVLDFGLAKLLRPSGTTAGERATTETVSDTAAVAGTLPYMSPEQLRGEPADARADIYATGAVLYEMATGQRPFREGLASRLTDAILHQPPVPPRAVNPRITTELERIILKCLEKDPENRYQSAKELVVDLRRLATPGSAVAAAMAAKTKTRRALAPVGWAMATLVVLAGMLVGWNVGGWRERFMGRRGALRIESLAVLPLENLSRDPGQDYFADGMTEVLITDLAQIGALRVISRTSVMQYKGAKKPLPEIARELHVDAVVVGSVAREGNRVRISVQLIHAPTDRHLWAKSYERDLHDVLALQSRVAQAIADEIRVKLTPQQRAKLGSSRQVNPEAQEAYLKGLYFFNEGRDYLRTPKRAESLQKGIEYFKQAIAIDPNYALAYSGLARSYYWLAGVLDPALNARQSRAAAEKALQIDDTLAEAHAALAYLMFRFDWQWSEAQREYKRAIELNPSYAEAHQGYAIYLAAVGKLDEAIAEIQRAIELDPLTLPQKMNAGGIYTCAGQYDRAIEQFRNLLELNPNSALAHFGLGEAYWDKGMHAEAVAEFRKSMDISGGTPKGSPFLPRAYPAYAAWEQRGDPTRLLDELKKLSKRESLSPVSIAGVYAAVGDKEHAFSWLEKAYEERAGALTYIKCDREFESLRSDPRFQNLLRRMGLPP